MFKKTFILLIVAFSVFVFGCSSINKETSTNTASLRGCCSWHNGVCGCAENGRVICCDGKYSPTCRCDRNIAEPTVSLK